MSNGFFYLLVKIVCFLIFEISNRFAKIFDNSSRLRVNLYPAVNDRPEPVNCGGEDICIFLNGISAGFLGKAG